MAAKRKTGVSTVKASDGKTETLPAGEHEAQQIINLLIGVLCVQSILQELSRLSPVSAALSSSLTPKTEELLLSVLLETGLSHIMSISDLEMTLNFTFKGSSTISQGEAVTVLEIDVLPKVTGLSTDF